MRKNVSELSTYIVESLIFIIYTYFLSEYTTFKYISKIEA